MQDAVIKEVDDVVEFIALGNKNEEKKRSWLLLLLLSFFVIIMSWIQDFFKIENKASKSSEMAKSQVTFVFGAETIFAILFDNSWSVVRVSESRLFKLLWLAKNLSILHKKAFAFFEANVDEKSLLLLLLALLLLFPPLLMPNDEDDVDEEEVEK